MALLPCGGRLDRGNIFNQKAQEWDEHPTKRERSQRFAVEVKKNVAMAPTMELLEGSNN